MDIGNKKVKGPMNFWLTSLIWFAIKYENKGKEEL
jgi:hypothetical protein